MHARVFLTVFAAAVSIATAGAGDGPSVRIWQDQLVPGPTASQELNALDSELFGVLDSVQCPAPAEFHNSALARFGDAVPGGGTLYLFAGAATANANTAGQAAFFSRIDGVERNQGIFVTDGTTLRPIVIGCGGGGGSGQPGSGVGDPSPIGGTFSGLFDFTPAFNDAGDVLFMSDINGGTSPRGLFLYQAATQHIVKVIAIGDTSPAGGTITSLGLGNLNNAGDVILLAEHNAVNGPVHVLKWSNGTLSTFVRVGDPAPNGGTYSLIGREYFGYVDGTRVYIGNLPGINDAGQVAFFSLVSGGIAERGIFLRTGSTTQWYLKAGDATPAGGTYLDFWQPLLNASGQIGIFCDIRLGPNQYTSSWIAGQPGSYRKVLAFYDPIDGGQVWGMAVSRNPVRAFDDCGNLIAWASIRMPDTTELDHTLFCPADGSTPLTIARKGDPTPVGGNYTGMTGWPSLVNGLQGTFGAFTPGSGYPNVFFRLQGFPRGDLNCDGRIDFGDINPFVLALSNPAGYHAAYPNCDIMLGDINQDGQVNFGDINPFVALLSGQ